MRGKRLVPVAAVVVFALITPPALAQYPPLDLPQPSQEARVSQTVGITDLDIAYHRPAVNKRQVWGSLVPYKEVWRAGANEATTFTASTDVTVEGKPLAKGMYGLYLLPSEKEWTVIFSKESGAWGSNYYKEEDALRVTVTPQATSEHIERMLFTFDDPSNTETTVSLRWEKLRVSFKVAVDTPNQVVASLRHQLRGLAGFFWQPWNGAANYCVQNDVNLDEALTWADKSIEINENFTNTLTKARLLDKKGKAAEAAALREKAGELASSEQDVNAYGYMLLGEKKYDQAIVVFKKNVKDHPESWNTYDSLAEAYALTGDKAQAIALYTKALSMVKADDQKKRISAELAKLK
jgi:tetratricopeptide (TPR) repeat protein